MIENGVFGPAPKSKVVHRGGLVNQFGQVSARCFKNPHPIDLRRATWTNRDGAVTCPKCLKWMKESSNV